MVYEKIIKNPLWSPDSWRKKRVLQNIEYKNTNLLKFQQQILEQSAPLFSQQAIVNCKSALANIVDKKYFILQAGDCAETIKDKAYTISYANNMSNFILELSNKLQYNTKRKTIAFARMAGQMAKPRSLHGSGSDACLYRGDLINSFQTNVKDNKPDTQRLLQAYEYSKALIDYVEEQNYNLYFCHESFLLPYEQALVRRVGGQYYSSSAHMLWVGERTRDIDCAHIEFCRGIANPIGIKIGPEILPEDILKLCDILNPQNEKGKLSFIIRMGVDKIEHKLPSLIEIINKAKKNVLWLCDPMHGNNILYKNYKTRFISSIKSETKSFFGIHRKLGSYGAGIHLELTYEDVTECLENENLHNIKWKNYKSYCDARLNAQQARDFIDFLGSIIAGY